ncbi:hypothetical protein [Tardiphaga sp. 841_E9_N1_2]|uniref:hypothetical protein n=1 Tax=Tardiphaga sp. 841_E9_N1_2 TaxID=3240762 RepID=UPI003F2341C1
MRWQATIHYRTDAGIVDVEHRVSELHEIHDLVERGPHWDTVEKIEVIRINHIDSAALTVEQAERM